MYSVKIDKKRTKITKTRNFGVLNKLRKGVNITKISPIKLLIKNRG